MPMQRFPRPDRSPRPSRASIDTAFPSRGEEAGLAGPLVPLLIGAGPDNDQNKNNKGKDRTGEQIYRQMCASCHGASGEGTDDHYPRHR